jgi:hypothetical protein
MAKKACCVWCWRKIILPDIFDPKDPTKDVVCSEPCRQQEAEFRQQFSDEAIMKWRKDNGWY